MLRKALLIGEDIVSLDEGLGVQTSGRTTFRILPLAGKRISPASGVAYEVGSYADAIS